MYLSKNIEWDKEQKDNNEINSFFNFSVKNIKF